ncbi:Peptide deformylase [Flavobacteriales bacterium]|nr:Peptide deformylase [Flavobacteriales bacterium]MCL4816760.1 peptide deformylase [Flavobacteriales bacterium]WKZ74087.1 MAG: peptide deformylase [Vicingaceae bacterium]GIK70383.1 MAG: peptide deformylase [Bacteroidota bacterium]CAG0991748.1 Peptide deformylase [Flavobacteriales bacterium]
MILPIVAYGTPVLRKVAEEIDADYPDLKEFIANMYETMYNAGGVGLAAPQVGKSIRLFVVDAAPFEEDEPSLKNFKKVFINPIILEEKGQEWKFNEGCLSIPGIREDVSRKPTITIEYFDEKFKLKEETYEGIAARIIQHEYDHIEGVLFTDRINPLKRQLLKKKLSEIAKGNVEVKYKMRFPLKVK